LTGGDGGTTSSRGLLVLRSMLSVMAVRQRVNMFAYTADGAVFYLRLFDKYSDMQRINNEQVARLLADPASGNAVLLTIHGIEQPGTCAPKPRTHNAQAHN
jgi:hypothetical protein